MESVSRKKNMLKALPYLGQLALVLLATACGRAGMGPGSDGARKPPTVQEDQVVAQNDSSAEDLPSPDSTGDVQPRAGKVSRPNSGTTTSPVPAFPMPAPISTASNSTAPNSTAPINAASESAIFNPDCYANEHCSVVILHIPEGYTRAPITTHDVRRIHQVEQQRKEAWLKTLLPYRAVDFFFGISTLQEGWQQLIDIEEAKKLLQASGLNSTIQGTGGQMVVVYGPDLLNMLQRRQVEAYTKMGLTILGWIPTTKLLGSAYKGVKLGAGARTMEKYGADGVLSNAEGRELGEYLFRIGEPEAGMKVYRTMTVQGAREAFKVAAKENLKVVWKWARWTAFLRISGISIPDRPKSLAPADLAKFAYRQGALYLSGDITNPTTRALRLTGEKAWDYLTEKVVQIKNRFQGSDISTEEALAQVAEICEGECSGKEIPAAVINRMSTTDVIRHLEILVDDEGNATVKFNPNPVGA